VRAADYGGKSDPTVQELQTFGFAKGIQLPYLIHDGTVEGFKIFSGCQGKASVNQGLTINKIRAITCYCTRKIREKCYCYQLLINALKACEELDC